MPQSSTRSEAWRRLLSAETSPKSSGAGAGDRSPFSIDYDRVVFSSAFRRLQDKTQVFPLSTSDYTRTRLTHSVEVSSVGRTLAEALFAILQEHGIDPGAKEADLSTIVATACLAHDIGNPPFGHSGEAAIQRAAAKHIGELEKAGAITAQEATDLKKFEGNAQGFRILTRLQMKDRVGGMKPTSALVGAIAKYPRPSVLKGRDRAEANTAEKKFNFFADDEARFRALFEGMGRAPDEAGAYRRHPLAYLTEAADDICYCIIDLEDAYKLGVVSYAQVEALLGDIVPLKKSDRPVATEDEQVARMRAMAISYLVRSCTDAMREHLAALETGALTRPLVEVSSLAEPHEAICRFAREDIYTDARVLQIETAGFKTISGLFELFADALLTSEPDTMQKKVRKLFPIDLLREPGQPRGDRDALIAALTPYQRLLAVSDYISGMTDSFAIDLFQKLSGTKLPD